MPLQNRVNPKGEICQSTHKGNLMGNRGHLHDANKLLKKQWQLTRWIICVLQFKDRKREVMQKNRYTELFFWDEATALAAGHRPCAECQRARFNQFSQLWKASNGKTGYSTNDMDKYLHDERLNRVKPSLKINTLPDGVMIEYKSNVYLKLTDNLYFWTFGGYELPIKITNDVMVSVLTPPSIVKTLNAGYIPLVIL